MGDMKRDSDEISNQSDSSADSSWGAWRSLWVRFCTPGSPHLWWRTGSEDLYLASKSTVWMDPRNVKHPRALSALPLHTVAGRLPLCITLYCHCCSVHFSRL